MTATTSRSPRSLLGFSGPRPVWLLTAVLGLASTATYLLWVRSLPTLAAPISIPWWVLAVGFVISESFVVSFQFRREAHSFSMSDIPLVMGLFFAPPPLVVVAQVSGALVGLVLHARQVSLKLFFNLAQMSLQSCVAVVLFHSIVARGAPLGPSGWLGALVAVFVTNLMSDLAITAAISLTDGRQPFPAILGFGTVVTLANVSLALAAVVILWTHPAAAWLIVVLGVIIYLAYQSHATLSAEHERLEVLYESTRAAQRSLDIEEITTALLTNIKRMFRSETAEIALFFDGGKSAVVTASSPDGSIHVSEPGDLDPTEGVWARVVAEGQAVLLARPISSKRLRGFYAARGIRDAMVAPLPGEKDCAGTILVGNRLGEVRTYNEGDLKLFETVVNHAGVALENARLMAEVRQHADEREHRALHDLLTGLPNRLAFQEWVTRAIDEASRSSGCVAVLLMDIDRFKEINDALGHDMGEVLLGEVASRMRATAASGELVARLGGDEFAVAAFPLADEGDARTTARRFLGALRDPFTLEGLSVDVEGSIGIALFPAHGDDAAALMRRADIAMYRAKRVHSGSEVYDAVLDEHSPQRLALLAELRDAIDARKLDVHYQPKASLASGRITSVEALVRWQHGERGMVTPDEFIPLAEQTGLIKRLTVHVLDTALGQVHRWRHDGLDLSVAVNLSARSLLDLDLPSEVSRLLERWDVEPQHLELELTESVIMADPVRIEGVLRELSAIGVEIGIDDFGTGYSSLSHLRRLPVDEIKIDRSFVIGMTSDENDAVIVRSTIELGRQLGLRVVAEGVETREAWERLLSFGCDMAQGYVLSRPQAPAPLEDWLRAYGPRVLPSGAAAGPRGSGPPGLASRE